MTNLNGPQDKAELQRQRFESRIVKFLIARYGVSENRRRRILREQNQYCGSGPLYVARLCMDLCFPVQLKVASPATYRGSMAELLENFPQSRLLLHFDNDFHPSEPRYYALAFHWVGAKLHTGAGAMVLHNRLIDREFSGRSISCCFGELTIEPLTGLLDAVDAAAETAHVFENAHRYD